MYRVCKFFKQTGEVKFFIDFEKLDKRLYVNYGTRRQALKLTFEQATDLATYLDAQIVLVS